MSDNIDDKTTIPLFSVFAAISSLVGGMIWLTSIDSKAEKGMDRAAQAKEIALEARDDIKEIRLAVQRIEIKLGTYPKNRGE